MAPLTVNADVFIAIAEPNRRAIIELLAQGERAVGEIVDRLRLAQPMVSKHLRVLREVGVVRVRSLGRKRYYELNAQALRPVHAWVSVYEQMWSEQLDKLGDYLDSEEGGVDA